MEKPRYYSTVDVDIIDGNWVVTDLEIINAIHVTAD